MQKESEFSRRKFLGYSSAALAAAATLNVAGAQETSNMQSQSKSGSTAYDPHAANEAEHGPQNSALEQKNKNAAFPPETDNGTVPPFKYSFALSRRRVEDGGWTRQVTARELPIARTIAGVEMRLTAGGVRELHWHVSSEWAIMLYGNARITAVNPGGKSFVSDVGEGDLWLFPPGVPHSIQGLGPDGCQFLLVFDDGNFDEFQTFLLTDLMVHTPKEVLAKNFNVSESSFANIPKRELFIFQTELPGDVKQEQASAAQGTGTVEPRFDFRPSQMKPTKVTAGGEVKIIDANNFPVTPIAAAIVTLKPGALREVHWHPNADEWQYYIKGKGSMGVFTAASRSRTMDFEAGDVGYVLQSVPHYIENTGDSDLIYLEMFKSPRYEDISLSQWLAHTPALLVDQHLRVGQPMLASIAKEEVIIAPR